MINFILPKCYDNKLFNNILSNYIHDFPEHLNFNEHINIFAQSGNTSFSFWHGGINTNWNNKVVLQPDMIDFSNKTATPIVLDFSNIYLNINENWIKDPHVKAILQVFENKGNYIKVLDNKIRELIQKYYSGYDFILKLNQENELNDFQFIELKSIIPQINKFKCWYPLGNPCLNCEHNCEEEENFYQYTFSKKSLMHYCSKFQFDAVKEREKYDAARLLGYSYFYFDDIPQSQLENFNNFLIKFFIKSEYIEHFQKELTKI